MSGNSNVGQASVYEDGDQRNAPESETRQEKKDARFHEGKENSHKANDSSRSPDPPAKDPWKTVLMTYFPEDERSIANKLAREEKVGLLPIIAVSKGAEICRSGYSRPQTS